MVKQKITAFSNVRCSLLLHGAALEDGKPLRDITVDKLLFCPSCISYELIKDGFAFPRNNENFL